jgi:hypothetical protein
MLPVLGALIRYVVGFLDGNFRGGAILVALEEDWLMTLNDVVMITKNGGEMIVDGSKFDVDGLVQIASATAGRRNQIIVRNLKGFTVDGLMQIATNGYVILDLTDD